MSGRAPPRLSPVRRHPVQPYQAPTEGSVDERLSDMAQEITKKADRDSVPNFVAVTLRGEDGKDYLIYVDTTGTLRCVPVALP